MVLAGRTDALRRKMNWDDYTMLLAVIAADKKQRKKGKSLPTGDLEPLVARLRSGPLSDEARELVADLLSRHQLKRKPGGRARPAYEDPSDDQINVMAAADDYHERGRKRGESRDKAIARLAREYGCAEYQLRNYLDGSTRQARKDKAGR
jgi:hypothetical protein